MLHVRTEIEREIEKEKERGKEYLLELKTFVRKYIYIKKQLLIVINKSNL